jgi:ATP-dependent helicase HrpA
LTPSKVTRGLWAQQLGTARPVSEQRIYRAIDAVRL